MIKNTRHQRGGSQWQGRYNSINFCCKDNKNSKRLHLSLTIGARREESQSRMPNGATLANWVNPCLVRRPRFGKGPPQFADSIIGEWQGTRYPESEDRLSRKRNPCIVRRLCFTAETRTRRLVHRAPQPKLPNAPISPHLLRDTTKVVRPDILDSPHRPCGMEAAKVA